MRFFALLLGFAMLAVPFVGGATSGTNVRVTTHPANEVMLAVNPTNPANEIAVAKDYVLGASPVCGSALDGAYDVWGGVYTTFDGGATWTQSLFPGYPGDTHTSAASGFQCMSDPVVVFGSDGRAHFTGLVTQKAIAGQLDVSEWGMVYGNSADGGRSWTNTQLIWQGTHNNGPSLAPVVNLIGDPNNDKNDLVSVADSWEDKQWQVVDPTDPNAIYVTWDLITSIAAEEVMMSRSLDGGVTWVTESIMPVPDYGALSQPAMDNAGNLYVALLGTCLDATQDIFGSGSCEQVMKFTSHATAYTIADVGPVWSNSQAPDYRVTPIPVLAVDRSTGPNAGHVYVAYSNYDVGSGGWWRVTVGRSADGQHFATANLPGPSGDLQDMPQVAVNGQGVVGVLHYDDSGYSYNCGNNGCRWHTNAMRAVFDESTNGGVSWSGETPVSTTSFSPYFSYHQDGFTFMGDYLGLDTDPSGAFHAAWTDTRNGESEVYSATIAP
ncbi:MAG: hypothetical protein ACYDCK_08735 [Thermoplasmatota archaeon]